MNKLWSRRPIVSIYIISHFQQLRDMPVATVAGGLTTLCRFESRDRKGGVLTPPQNGPNPLFVSRPAQLVPTGCAGRETGE